MLIINENLKFPKRVSFDFYAYNPNQRVDIISYQFKNAFQTNYYTEDFLFYMLYDRLSWSVTDYDQFIFYICKFFKNIILNKTCIYLHEKMYNGDGGEVGCPPD